MPRESLVGTTIAQYAITDEIGEGGTSAVYRAHHPTHGTVALKILREKLRQDRTAVTRFLREAEYGSRVVHPNVVQTIEIGQSDTGLHFLAIEWAQGELLESYARRRGVLDPGEVTNIVRQIAAGVEAAHLVNIVHRDLKPDNVMYDPELGEVKLLDFGIAADTQATDERLTRAGFFVGTLMYVAPEALSGELVTAAADQYSLATITFFLLTGVHPYSAKTPREMFTQLLTAAPLSLNAAKEEVQFHSAVEAVVMRGLARKPEDRFTSTTAFAEALTGALSLEHEDESGFMYRMRDFLRRGW